MDLNNLKLIFIQIHIRASSRIIVVWLQLTKIVRRVLQHSFSIEDKRFKNK